MSEDKRNINIDDGDTLEDEFEVLMARLLWDDLDEVGASRLDVLVQDSPDFARRRREYTETRSFFPKAPGGDSRGLEIIAAASPLSQAPGMELRDDELLNDLPPELADFRRPTQYIPEQPGGTTSEKVVSLESRRSGVSAPSRGKFLGGGLAAAAVLLLGLGVTYYAVLESRPFATMTLTLGDCRAGTAPVKAGASAGTGVLKSGKDSVCDVQFPGVVVRLEPETRLSYFRKAVKSGREPGLVLELQAGRILVQAERVSQSTGLAVYTPGNLVRILGTRFTMDRNRPDSVRVQLVDGRAEVIAANYLYLPGLESGPSPSRRKELERKLPELFRAERRELAPGDYVRITRSRDFREKHQALFEKLNKAMAGQSDSGALSRARTLLDQASPGAKNALLSKPGVDKGRHSRYHALKLKRRFETMRLLKADELQPDAIVARKVDEQRILKLVRKTTDEPTYIYRVHLKNGKVHTGLLEQPGGGSYRLFTGERGIMIRKDQVEKIELVLDE